MKVFLVGLVILIGAAAASFASPAVLGPHPHPKPGAVLDAFPEKVHAWHSRGEGIEVHTASHIWLKGPDGKWLDGTVHVGEHVTFLAKYPGTLPEGTYKVWSIARWSDGLEEHVYNWEFSVKREEKKGEMEEK